MMLNRIIMHKREEICARRRKISLAELRSRAEGRGRYCKRPLYASICRKATASLSAGPPELSSLDKKGGRDVLNCRDGIAGRPAVIAEIKRASPSKGLICKNFDPATIARIYEKSGAAAVSVLTDVKFFGGSLDDLKVVRGATRLPLLCKDFIIDSYQVYEAAVYGAYAILLIAAVLDDAELQELYLLATFIGLECLVEVHDESELKKVFALGAKIIGINNRDLRSFNTDLNITFKLVQVIKEDLSAAPGTLLVSESGISTKEDMARLAGLGVDAVLVGEALMRSPDPGKKLRELLS